MTLPTRRLLLSLAFIVLTMLGVLHARRTERALTCRQEDDVRGLEDFNATARAGTKKDNSWTFTSRSGKDRARADLRLTDRQPFTPAALTLSLTNVGRLNVRFVGKETEEINQNFVFSHPVEKFALPLTDLPEAVVRMVILATPASPVSATGFSIEKMEACVYSTTTTLFSTAPVMTKNNEAPVSTCGVSKELDRVNGVTSGQQLSRRRRVVGGTSTGHCNVIPWQVRLALPGGEMCGGSIIEASYILTAGHCIPDSGTINITAGDYDTGRAEGNEQVRLVSVSDVTVHPEYYTNVYGAEVNDIAVVKLSEPLDMTRPCVEPVCLDKDFTVSGQNCTISGWGTLEASGDISSTLQYANVRTETGDNCVSAFGVPYPTYISDASHQLCAGFPQGGTDACKGDTGGPLVCRDNVKNTYVQTGIISYGNGCGDPNFPGLFTKTSSYHDWIQAQINN